MSDTLLGAGFKVMNKTEGNVALPAITVAWEKCLPCQSFCDKGS